MTDAKHTPGPWHTIDAIESDYLNGNKRRLLNVFTKEPLGHCGHVAEINTKNPDADANTALITAAPEMLEQLEIEQEWYQCPLTAEWANTFRAKYAIDETIALHEWLASRRAAIIAQAKGGEV